MSTHTVFVYGTLKSGYWNNRLIVEGGGLPVARGITRGLFHLRDVGFPVASYFGPEVRPVSGELWRVGSATLARLDCLEGVPHHYQRVRVTVRTVAGAEIRAWMYVQDMPNLHNPECPVDGDGAYFWSRADRRAFHDSDDTEEEDDAA